MAGSISMREHQLAQARYALEKMADMIEEACAAGEDHDLSHSHMVLAKCFGMLVRDTGSTALHPVGPWGGLSMVALLMCDFDLTVHCGELPALVDTVWAARRIAPKESPRGRSEEAHEFREKLESIQARVLGYGR
jgi:hypothetical protein